MKYIIITLLCAYISLNINAQDNTPNIGGINIGWITPTEIDGLNDSSISKLNTKMIQIITANDVTTSSFGGFVLYPLINVNDISVVEGGMRNIYTSELDLILCIRQVSSGMVVGTTSQTLRGSGFDKSKAIYDAISTIQPNQKELNDFIREGKERIVNYYIEQRPTIIKKARELAGKQQYQEALYLLATYPESLPGYAEVSKASVEIFVKYQNHYCSQLLQEAKSLISIKEYDAAAYILMSIDAQSKCSAESKTLIKQVERSVEKADAKELEIFMKLHNSDVELEKHRINAVKEVAKAYYRNQLTINYTQVILSRGVFSAP